MYLYIKIVNILTCAEQCVLFWILCFFCWGGEMRM